VNKLYSDFNKTVEGLSASMVSFWRVFEKSALNVEEAQTHGTQISSYISTMFSTFNDLD